MPAALTFCLRSPPPHRWFGGSSCLISERIGLHDGTSTDFTAAIPPDIVCQPRAKFLPEVHADELLTLNRCGSAKNRFSIYARFGRQGIRDAKGVTVADPARAEMYHPPRIARFTP